MSVTEAEWTSRVYLAGEWVPGAAGGRDVVEPATGDVIGRVGVAGPADVAHAIARAVEAQRAWANTDYITRAGILRRAGDLFRTHQEEFNDWIVREAGGVRAKAAYETNAAAQECYEAAALASHPFGDVLRSELPRLSFSRQVPVGVVGVIAPFNGPLLLAIRSVAPALAVGNAVVLKPDLRTAVSGGATLVDVFEEAGLPPGLLSVLPGEVDVGEALVSDPRVRVIAFTGSTRAGRAIAKRCGELLKRSHLELGGNSAIIVMDDVDVRQAAAIGAFSTFNHAGQVCMAAGRHLVDARIIDDYVAALVEQAEALPVGTPDDYESAAIGPIIDAHQRDHVHDIVTSSVELGARVVTGGTFDELFYRPTVLTEIPRTAPAYAEEVFGPVAPVVGYSSLDEAIEMAAASEYGLSLSILTGDAMGALEVASRIPTGAIHINDATIADEPIIPFGGTGASGTGSRVGGSQANLDAFTETQWVTAQSTLRVYG